MSYSEFFSYFVGKSENEIFSDIWHSFSKEFKKGGEAGWVFPPIMPIPVYTKLVNDVNLDERFCNYFDRNFHKIIDYINENLGFFNPFLRSLLEESLWAYRENKLSICVPALFAVLEGALVDISNDGDRSKIRYFNSTKEIADNPDFSDQALPIISLSYFLGCAFKPSDFNDTPLPTINRHWAQHGRYIEKPPLESVYQLFAALSVIIWILEIRNKA